MPVRKNNPFNIMIVGNIGLGKTSFINTLLNNNIINITKPKDNAINVYSINLPLKQIKKINIITSPNLNFELNDTELHLNIEKYLKDQFNKYLDEETKIKRSSNFIDTRVNLMLFFIGHSGLIESDIIFLKRICHIVNIIPIIGKSDGLTVKEITELRKKVKKTAFEFQIRFFKFEINSIIEDTEFFETLKSIYEIKETNKSFSLNDLIPFRIINRCWIKKDEERYNGNLHVNFDNLDISDFKILKEVLLSDFSDELINSTHYELYEMYREDVLLSLMNNKTE